MLSDITVFDSCVNYVSLTRRYYFDGRELVFEIPCSFLHCVKADYHKLGTGIQIPMFSIFQFETKDKTLREIIHCLILFP